MAILLEASLASAMVVEADEDWNAERVDQKWTGLSHRCALLPHPALQVTICHRSLLAVTGRLYADGAASRTGLAMSPSPSGVSQCLAAS